jgi:hypothetical protein
MSAYSYTASLSASADRIRKVDVDETRANLATERSARSLSTSFTDPTITASTTQIRKVHIDELYSQSQSLIGYGTRTGNAPWTDATITASVTRIRAQHWKEVRQVIDDSKNNLR